MCGKVIDTYRVRKILQNPLICTFFHSFFCCCYCWQETIENTECRVQCSYKFSYFLWRPATLQVYTCIGESSFCCQGKPLQTIKCLSEIQLYQIYLIIYKLYLIWSVTSLISVCCLVLFNLFLFGDIIFKFIYSSLERGRVYGADVRNSGQHRLYWLE